MKKSRLLGAVCAFTLLFVSLSSHAASLVCNDCAPGESFQTIFSTNDWYLADDPRASQYDYLAQASADYPSSLTVGNSWSALVATVDDPTHHTNLINPSDNTTRVVDVFGVTIAESGADFWAGNFEYKIFDQFGGSPYRVWTGYDEYGNTVYNGQSRLLGESIVFNGCPVDACSTSFYGWASGSKQGADPYINLFSIYAVSDVNVAPSAVPLPAAVWFFGSGLLGLVGIARRKKAA